MITINDIDVFPVFRVMVQNVFWSEALRFFTHESLTCHNSWRCPASSPVGPPGPLQTRSSTWRSSVVSYLSPRSRWPRHWGSPDSPAPTRTRTSGGCSCSGHTSECLSGPGSHLRRIQEDKPDSTCEDCVFIWSSLTWVCPDRSCCQLTEHRGLNYKVNELNQFIWTVSVFMWQRTSW